LQQLVLVEATLIAGAREATLIAGATLIAR